MAKHNQRPPLDLQVRRGDNLISELGPTALALLMRENAEALLLDLAGTSGAFNLDRPPRSSAQGTSLFARHCGGGSLYVVRGPAN
jgi:hypothetical protein